MGSWESTDAYKEFILANVKATLAAGHTPIPAQLCVMYGHTWILKDLAELHCNACGAVVRTAPETTTGELL